MSSTTTTTAATAAGKTSDGTSNTTLLVNESSAKRWQSFSTRVLWSVVLVGGFVGTLLAGHLYVMLLIFAVQVLSFREVTSIGYVPAEAMKLPWFRTVNWYIFASVNYYLYGESLILFFFHTDNHVASVPAMPDLLKTLVHNHVIISYSLYIAGLVLFVLNLHKDHYRFQFRQLAWTHMALLFVVGQPIFIVDNLLSGLVWYATATSARPAEALTASTVGSCSQCCSLSRTTQPRTSGASSLDARRSSSSRPRRRGRALSAASSRLCS